MKTSRDTLDLKLNVKWNLSNIDIASTIFTFMGRKAKKIRKKPTPVLIMNSAGLNGEHVVNSVGMFNDGSAIDSNFGE